MSYIGNTPTTQSFTPAIDYFSGNGSSTAFTLSRPVASVAQVQVTISNVPQTPGTAYSVSGNTLTFSSAPPTGINNIYVYYTSPVTQVIQPGQQTVGATQLVNPTGTGNPVLQTSPTLTTPTIAQINSTASLTPPLFYDNSNNQIGTLCRAWVQFNGTSGANPVIRASFNVSSVTRTGTGAYTINFANAMPDSNYSFTSMSGGSTGLNFYMFMTSYNSSSISVYNGVGGTNFDTGYGAIAIFR
jgi:hypothetical protein